jgi:hypothetical protein
MPQLLVTLERVISAMEKNQMPFWILKDGRTEIERMQEPESTVDASVQFLRDCMAQLSGQYVDIVISNKCHSDKASGGKNYKNYEYKIKLQGSGVNVYGSDSIQGGMIGLLKEIGNLNTKLVQQEYQMKLEKLEEKMNKGISGLDHPLLKQGVDILADIASRIDLPFLKSRTLSPPLAGTPDVETTNTKTKRTKEETKIIVDSINILFSVDPDFINTIQTLASFAKRDTKKYLSFIPMIPK